MASSIQDGWGWLKRAAPGSRAAKTALAVGMAWWLGSLLGEPLPIFAALGAFVAVLPTVAGSIKRTGLQLIGILGGVALATLFSHVATLGPILIALAVLFGLWLGRLLRSPDRIGAELSVTALLVVVWGQGDLAFGAARLWETALGGAVAVATNALVLPPSYLHDVFASLDSLAERLASGLPRILEVFREQPEHEGVDEVLAEMRAVRDIVPSVAESLSLAEQALEWSPLVRGERDSLSRCRSALTLYRHAAIHAASMARILKHHSERPHSWEHGHLESTPYLIANVESLAGALRSYQRYVREDDHASLEAAFGDLEAAEAALSAFFKVAHEEQARTEVERFVDIAAIASDQEHLTKDLGEALREN